MKNLEKNKIAAAILVAGLVALTSGKIANFLYYSGENSENTKRGFTVEATANASENSTANAKEEKIDTKVLMASADATKGAEIFKKCATCHSNDTSGKHKIGPNLHKVFGAKKAANADFAYSDAMKGKGGSWDTDSLFAFLKKPVAFVPGTKMTFPGLKDPKEIADVIKYLQAN